MTTLRTLVSDGLRESGLIQIGAEPDAEEFSEGLRRLKNIISSLFGQELGENLIDRTFGTSGLSSSRQGTDYTSQILSSFIPSNTRLVLNNDSAVTLYLDPQPKDGARLSVVDTLGNLATYNVTLNGNGRNIEAATSVVLTTNSLNREWFYRADTANWVRVTDLTADDDNPFPSEFDDFLSLLLAMRINPRYGAKTAEETVVMLRRYTTKFKARYRQAEEIGSELGLLNLNRDGFDYSTDTFNRGNV